MTALLSIKPHTRRRPLDPYEDKRKAMTAELRLDKSKDKWTRKLAWMDRQIAAIVVRDIRKEMN